MGLNRGVSVVGAGMTRFHNRLHADKTGRELFVEAAIEAAGSVDKGFRFRDAGALFVGNFAGDVFEGQGHTAAVMADWLGINPVPAYRIEDACASSGAALNLGVITIASGMADVVLVGGVEKMSRLTTEQVTDALALAADSSYETSVGFTFPSIYAAIASAYFKKYGTAWEQLAAVTIKNHRNGALNPKAQFQSDILTTARKIGERDGRVFKDEMEFLRSDLNPVIASPLRLFDCCPVSDGASAVVLAADEVAWRYTDTPVKIAGIGQASDTIALHSRPDFTTLGAAVKASEDAYRMAGATPRDIDVADVHDCFTIAEVVATEDLGFFPKGEGGKAAEEGLTALNGSLPINPDGGLKAKGHPVGATGVAMAYEMFKQVRGQADRHQVKGAEVGLSHNVGAAGASVAVQIYRRG
ncbi:MAG: thiolase domain-containing protein [Candidatus Bathyarchaeia archaeon]